VPKHVFIVPQNSVYRVKTKIVGKWFNVLFYPCVGHTNIISVILQAV